MDWHIEECRFERTTQSETDTTDEESESESIVLEPGFDKFQLVGKRDSENRSLYIYEIKKETILFETEMRWVFDPEDEDLDDDEMESRARTVIEWEGSYQISHYLDSMALPPIPGILEESTLDIEGIGNSHESED